MRAFDYIAYKVHGGTVTLLGEVVRPTLRSDPEYAVKRIEGVGQSAISSVNGMFHQSRWQLAEFIDAASYDVSCGRSNRKSETRIMERPIMAPQGQGPLGGRSSVSVGIQPVEPTRNKGKADILARTQQEIPKRHGPGLLHSRDCELQIRGGKVT